MKKRNWKDVAFGVALAGVVGLTFSPTLAATTSKQITAQYTGIQLVVDGAKVTPKDASGKVVEPFIYEGTTYLPVRAVGEALGKKVTWDGATQTVYLGQVPGQANYLVDVCPPYQKDECTIYKGEEGKFFAMGGKKYSNGFVLYNNFSEAYAMMNTDNKYHSMTFTLGHIDEASMDKGNTLEIYLDGKFSQSIELDPGAVPHEVTIPLNGALSVKVSIPKMQYGYAKYGLAEIVLN